MIPETLSDLAELVGIAKQVESMALDGLSCDAWLTHRELAVLKQLHKRMGVLIDE